MNANARFLRYPRDRFKLALLSIPAFQEWYMAQDPREMIFLGNDPKFKRFMFWAYVWKVGLRRWVFKIRRAILPLKPKSAL